ncbi:ABC transporter ATP-binding protein [Actinopolymorpha pittospori]|uniref:ABC-type multidrug transport system fused ATPase/permease subunit n=1 Tax=Actinopolymorpha pittospori TaxID=648752 RepID=A0A927RPI6_9ACTN|nr:ABC transporter ATP-binding protein [Actinopolymorpha pittospori]MBE1612166.1 ABC-type multidrug transport system fused ATPase/permease subunit [Actinopolymorpha pittospori]
MAIAVRPTGAGPGAWLTRLRGSAEWQLLFHATWRADRRLAAAWWTLIVVRSALPPALAVVTGWLVGAIAEESSVLAPLTAVGVLFALLQTLGPLHSELGTNLGDRTAASLQDRLATAAVGPVGIAHLEDPELASDFSLARDFDLGITSPQLRVCMSYIGSGFVSFGAGIVSAIVVCGFHWWAGLALLLAWVSPRFLLRDSIAWNDWRSDEVKEHQRHADYAYRMAVDSPAAKEIRLFGLAEWTATRFTERRKALLAISLEAMRLKERSVAVTLLVLVLGNGLVYWSLARAAMTGELGLSLLVAYAGAAVGVSALATMEFDWWLADGSRPVPVVAGLEPAMRGVGDLPAGTASAGGLPAREIRFENVSFSYRADSRPILDGLDLVIEAGTSLAIVGQNGAGKTTLVKLLARLYDPTAGTIRADGVDLRGLAPDSWRGQIAAAFQDFVRYQLPLRENVAPSGAPDDVVRTALEQAGASGLAELDTVLSKQYVGGTDLSGGQWQRVALARALAAVAQGARVVILDEPTAQLDVRGEAEVFDRILRATRGLTTILVSHRFSTVRHADRICVLEGGRVVELGTHDELMTAGGRYRTMFDLQAARFTEGGAGADRGDPADPTDPADGTAETVRGDA